MLKVARLLEPETPEDNPPGTLEEVAPEDPAEEPDYEEEQKEPVPAS